MTASADARDSFHGVDAAINAWWAENADSGFDPAAPVVRLHEPTFGPEEVVAATRQMLTTRVTMGEQVVAFERAYCDHFGYAHGVSNNSGSSANLLMMAALANPMCTDGLRPGDEVIVPALTWSTSLWPIVQTGLTPVLVDSDAETLNLDPAAVEKAIGPRTRAILAVPVYGNPCDYDALQDICARHNLILIEDGCESMGATYKGRPVGSIGRVGSFSFYYSHHITTLEGGICVTDDFELAELMRIIRAHGWVRQVEDRERWTSKYPDIDPKFLFVNEGYNLRITEPQAAIGLVQVPKLDGFIAARRANAAFYQDMIADYADLFTGQRTVDGGEHSWFGFCMVINPTAPFDRADICDFLNARGIETRPIIAGNLAKQPGTQLFPHRVSGDLASASLIMDRGFSIGVHQGLCEAARAHVADAFRDFVALRRRAAG